jgi:hypothetical protein
MYHKKSPFTVLLCVTYLAEEGIDNGAELDALPPVRGLQKEARRPHPAVELSVCACNVASVCALEVQIPASHPVFPLPLPRRETLSSIEIRPR